VRAPASPCAHPYCIADDEAEAIIEAEWVIIGLGLPIIGLELAIIDGEWVIIGVALPIMDAECDIIGEEPLEDVDEAGVEELEPQPASVRASTIPPPTGASRARERLRGMCMGCGGPFSGDA
jgi:hypothetical protein